MFSKIWTKKSMKSYLDKIEELSDVLKKANTILIGAGAGLSASSGLTYSGERFEKYFSDFRDKFGIEDMYSGGFYPFPDLETYWGWWSRNIWHNRYKAETNSVYTDLLSLVKDKNYFVITTNVDHQFQLSGFDKNRLFYMQGDYGLLQCSDGCHNKIYDNKELIEKMILRQKDMRVPSDLIPYCPKCKKPMVPHLRINNSFVQDEGWYMAQNRYDKFVNKYKDSNIVFLELGVGMNTPVWKKYPFWQMTANNKNAIYVCLNFGEADSPEIIKDRSICIDGDISKILKDLKQ